MPMSEFLKVDHTIVDVKYDFVSCLIGLSKFHERLEAGVYGDDDLEASDASTAEEPFIEVESEDYL